MTIEPGASTTVHFELCDRDLARWSSAVGDWVVTPGAFTVSIGASSRDLRGEGTVRLDGPAPVVALGRSSTMAEWLAHPVGRDVLIHGLTTAPGGDLSLLLADPDTVMMLGSFPMHRLATMMGDALGEGFVDGLLSQLA